jgi:hypothetical protein
MAEHLMELREEAESAMLKRRRSLMIGLMESASFGPPIRYWTVTCPDCVYHGRLRN